MNDCSSTHSNSRHTGTEFPALTDFSDFRRTGGGPGERKGRSSYASIVKNGVGHDSAHAAETRTTTTTTISVMPPPTTMFVELARNDINNPQDLHHVIFFPSKSCKYEDKRGRCEHSD